MPQSDHRIGRITIVTRNVVRCVCAAGLLTACNTGTRTSIAPATPHEQYARALINAGLQETVLGRDWLTAADSVLSAPLDVRLPSREEGMFSRGEARAVGYRIALEAGQRLIVTVRVTGLSMRIFVDLFEVSGDSARSLVHRASAREDSIAGDGALAAASVITRRYTISHEARERREMVLRLQPELLRDGRYAVELARAPILAFPVEGGDNRDAHKFAPTAMRGSARIRGSTSSQDAGPQLWPSPRGVVRSLKPNLLGGNVVWLFDDERALWIYYAHLERHAVVEGQAVRSGDTLGFVGNSGNARTTPPHLHFGIYKVGAGAIDPWPWVRRAEGAGPPVIANTASLGSLRSCGARRVRSPARRVDARGHRQTRLARHSAQNRRRDGELVSGGARGRQGRIPPGTCGGRVP